MQSRDNEQWSGTKRTEEPIVQVNARENVQGHLVRGHIVMASQKLAPLENVKYKEDVYIAFRRFPLLHGHIIKKIYCTVDI